MRYFVLHDAAGAITSVGASDDFSFLGLQANIPAGLTLIETSEDHQIAPMTLVTGHRVVNGEITARRAIAPLVNATVITADGADPVHISGLPVPCWAWLDGPLIVPPSKVDDGEITFTADHPGEYTVHVAAPPEWIDWSIVIHAV